MAAAAVRGAVLENSTSAEHALPLLAVDETTVKEPGLRRMATRGGHATARVYLGTAAARRGRAAVRPAGAGRC